MIKKQQILAATGDELSRLAGEVLQPENKGQYGNKKDGKYYCSECGKDLDELPSCGKECWFSMVRLTWPEAMKWRDWVVETDLMGANKYFEEVWRFSRDSCCEPWGRWFALYALPEHYIKAACLCKTERTER
jgi:hypothetical protein